MRSPTFKSAGAVAWRAGVIGASVLLAATGCKSTPEPAPVTWTPTPGPAESWALVLPESPSDSASGEFAGRRDVALGVAEASAAYPVDLWPDQRLPSLEHVRYLYYARRSDAFVVFRRPDSGGWWRY